MSSSDADLLARHSRLIEPEALAGEHFVVAADLVGRGERRRGRASDRFKRGPGRRRSAPAALAARRARQQEGSRA